MGDFRNDCCEPCEPCCEPAPECWCVRPQTIAAAITTAEVVWVYLFYWLCCIFCFAEMTTTEAEASLEDCSKQNQNPPYFGRWGIFCVAIRKRICSSMRNPKNSLRNDKFDRTAAKNSLCGHL
mgnify:CR=1 FL=1